ncbi:hypothetical protein BIU87_32210 [Streptomyces sp. ZS0098]|uniref:histidine kinase n=1 Tax=Streptomyces sp. ZS0098 TaxID=1904044 RepID=UPI000EFAEC16|nr:histidine kinase [Streptomyces sp. ZS0098]RMI89089.1 hypothetical protein BIU87_32210 [Streptomyces sp. ZS0098]
MDRARTAALAGRCLLWAGLVVPDLCAGRLGLSEPRPVWQQAAGAGVLAAATALARRRPLAAFALTAALCLADAPALFGLSYGPALAVFALLLGLRAERTGPAALGFAAVAAAGTVRIALGGVAAAAGWYAYTETHAVLEPAAYAALRTGTPLTSLALPDRQTQDPPSDRAPAPPEAAYCRYYRASGELFVSVDHYRLCFDDEGRLVAKDVVPRAGGRRSATHEEFTR